MYAISFTEKKITVLVKYSLTYNTEFLFDKALICSLRTLWGRFGWWEQTGGRQWGRQWTECRGHAEWALVEWWLCLSALVHPLWHDNILYGTFENLCLICGLKARCIFFNPFKGLTSRKTPWCFLPALPWRCGIELSVSIAFLVEFHSKQTLNQGVVWIRVLFVCITFKGDLRPEGRWGRESEGRAHTGALFSYLSW